MIEHAPSISMKFVCDRGVSHEIVRHRLFSFAQECLTGDTEIRKGMTIKNLYDRKQNPYGKTHNQTIRLRSCDEFGNIIPNRMLDVLYAGPKRVFEVITSLGYNIKTTMNHEFMCKDGSFEILENLRVGDIIKVNGRPSLLKISDEDLEVLYLKEGFSPLEISEEFGIPYRSVIRRLTKMGIFESHLNDHNKEKYNCNHTSESYEKMRQSVLRGYQEGRKVWNKGLDESNPSVKKQGDSLRKHHHDNSFGENNSGWKGGVSTRYYMHIMDGINCCELCGDKGYLEVHHKDTNRRNNDLDNLIKVCESCHELLHHGWYIRTYAINDVIESIRDMGIQETYDIVMERPYNNFVANGFIVHNSTRYCNYNDRENITYILPCWFSFQDQRHLLEGDINQYIIGEDPVVTWVNAMLDSEKAYTNLINTGWSPQQARSVLPNSLKTEIIVTGNLREWRHFFRLRTAKTAHPQMQEVANMALDMLKAQIPVVFDDIAN